VRSRNEKHGRGAARARALGLRDTATMGATGVVSLDHSNQTRSLRIPRPVSPMMMAVVSDHMPKHKGYPYIGLGYAGVTLTYDQDWMLLRMVTD